jgi:hypothetical protein
MYPTFPSAALSERLLHEVAQTSLSLDPVLFFYSTMAATAVLFWTVGVLVFGRPGSRTSSVSAAQIPQARITPMTP